MRQIKASEVKPGMEVEFTLTRKMMIHKNTTFGNHHRKLTDSAGGGAFIGADALVTVLSEPAPVQPEEPLWIAARAKVGDRRFFRVDESDRPWRKANCMGHIFPYQYSWSDVCSLGPVTVVPDQGWTVPDDTPEVPDRITEWPEDDTALREHKWCDRDGYRWTWIVADAQWECRDDITEKKTMMAGIPVDGPWTRIADA